MTINHYDMFFLICIYDRGAVNQQSMSTTQPLLQMKADSIHQMSFPQVVKPNIALLNKVLQNFI